MTPSTSTKAAPAHEIRVAVAAADLPAFAALADAAGWLWCDRGERVTTEDGPDGEAVLVVALPRALPRVDGGALVAVRP